MTRASWSPIKFLVALLLLITVAVGSLWGPAKEPDSRERDLLRSLLQLGLIAVVGGIAAAWTKHHWEREIAQRDSITEQNRRERDRLRELAAQRATIYREFMARVGSVYRAAKLIRRRLRAEGLWSGAVAPEILTGDTAIAYAKQMDSLNEVQLRLEELRVEAKRHPELREEEQLYGHIKEMERYLRGITGEFEKNVNRLRAGQLRVATLVHLDEFTDESDAVGKKTKLRFENNFASAYGEIARLLANLIGPATET
ncbi:MAG TPA: hypothetical protein VGS22_08145 [Thermoanaerobaculia bacterium]|jgi:hypothetical protein|nr:hypothetical protein [Thermoanaerobaculia bacterium]